MSRRLPPPLAKPKNPQVHTDVNEERSAPIGLPPRPPSHPLSRMWEPEQGALNQSMPARPSSDSFQEDATFGLGTASESTRMTGHRPSLDFSSDAIASPSRMTMPGIVIDLDAGSPPPTPAVEDAYEDEEELTEQELRALYDEEEMNRFLNMFSAYVREVRSVEPVKENLVPDAKQEPDPLRPSGPAEERILDAIDTGDDEWALLGDKPPVMNPPSTPAPNVDDTLSSRAVTYILPYLPPPGAPPPRFTLGRMQEVAQRLFLAIEPTYRPFLLHLFKLATWRDWNTSLFWCSVYWLLWLQDLLLPSLIIRVVWSLVKRRLRPYPTLAQLRERRKEIAKAEEFGDGITARITKTSKFGVRDAWKVWQDFRSLSDVNVGGEPPAAPPEEPISDIRMTEAVLNDTPSEQTMLMLALLALNSIADVHERVRNVFLWRKPSASRRYGIVLFVGFLVTLLVPAKYLAKMVYFAAGFAFWHVSPVLDALSVSGRSRMPPPLYDVPTDTDYAMQLMADRVANGHNLKPTKPRKLRKAIGKKSAKLKDTLSSTQIGGSVESLGVGEAESPTRRGRWVTNVVTAAKTSAYLAQEGYGLAMQIRAQVRADGADPLNPPEETNSFFVQHSTGPGLMTLSATSLSFALATGGRKFTIPRSAIHGVKKSNALGVKGLVVRWLDEGSGNGERTDKFHWVKNRDEAFARLVAGADQQWRRV